MFRVRKLSCNISGSSAFGWRYAANRNLKLHHDRNHSRRGRCGHRSRFYRTNQSNQHLDIRLRSGLFPSHGASGQFVWIYHGWNGSDFNARGGNVYIAQTPTGEVLNNAVITSATSTTVVTATPSAFGAIGTTADMFQARFTGAVEAPSNATPTTIGFAVASGSASDALTVYRGSYCRWQ